MLEARDGVPLYIKSAVCYASADGRKTEKYIRAMEKTAEAIQDENEIIKKRMINM